MSEGSFRSGSGPVSLYEAECYVQSLEPFGVDLVGSERWLRQHDMLEKLNIQAHHSAISRHDEFVVELFCSEEKIPVLIHELLVIEIWKEKVFPILKSEVSESASIKLYMVLFHEAALCNLLEVLMFHSEMIESAGESLLELVDYCYRKVTMLNTESFDKFADKLDPKKVSDEELEHTLTRQHDTIAMSVCAASIVIFRFLTDQIQLLPLGVLTRILNTNDMVLALIPLLTERQFTRRSEKGSEKFAEKKWEIVKPEDYLKLSKMEVQLWIAIYNLLMDNDCRAKYDLNSCRRDRILTIKSHLNGVLVDQLPILVDFRRFIEELSIMNPPEIDSQSNLVLEMVPEVRDKMLKSNDWEAIAERQLETVFRDDPEERRKEMERFAATYNLDALDDVLEDPKCARCGEPAEKRCARCRLEWYCSRACQVGAWANHKRVCDVVAAK
eukprot:926092_1